MSGSAAANAGYCPAQRPAIPFRAVNKPGYRGYDPGVQRHHLLPLQLLNMNCFGRMFAALGRRRAGFDDFRINGMLLPSCEESAIRLCMPLHRGPHHDYNAMVSERVGQIEHDWAHDASSDPALAMRDALFRLGLLQSALRRRLLDDRKRLILNRKDPLGTGFDFTELDAMAELLWQATA